MKEVPIFVVIFAANFLPMMLILSGRGTESSAGQGARAVSLTSK
jgi:hypothetical protein